MIFNIEQVGQWCPTLIVVTLATATENTYQTGHARHMSWLSNSLAVIDGATYVFMIDSPQPHDPRTTYRENVDPDNISGGIGV